MAGLSNTLNLLSTQNIPQQAFGIAKNTYNNWNWGNSNPGVASSTFGLVNDGKVNLGPVGQNLSQASLTTVADPLTNTASYWAGGQTTGDLGNAATTALNGTSGAGSLGSMASGWGQSLKNLFGDKSLMDGLGALGQGAAALWGAYNGWQANQLAEEQMNIAKDQWAKNWAAQTQQYNTGIDDKYRVRGAVEKGDANAYKDEAEKAKIH